MYAVIKTGGKQYRVAANDTIEIEKLKGAAGDTVSFTDVLMISDGGEIQWGAPFLAGAAVAGEIIGQIRGPKLIIVKKKRRKHHRRKKGHRQELTSVRITEILTNGSEPRAQAAGSLEQPAAAASETAQE